MKKLALTLCLTLILGVTSACKSIESSSVTSTTTTQTLQVENPTPSIDITTPSTTTTTATVTEEVTTPAASETTTTAPPVTTEKVTAKAPAKVTAPTATKATTTTPATTTAVTTVATTTAPPPANISTPANAYTALNFKEQKGMWISFLEFQNILKGKNETQFTASVKAMYDNCKLMGINTVYVHARSHSDSFYPSELFPWSKNVAGTIGQEPNFDPFKILVDQAHSRGLSVHAWVNPLRGVTEKDMAGVPSSYPMKQWYNDPSKKGTYIVNVDGTWYCSPAYKEVRTLITNGVKEILSKYDVDGIHIDDYFYPTTENSFDAAAFSASGASNRTQWRLDTVSQMVKEMYSGVKAVNSTAVFGISPQGNIANNYDFQYADVKKWASQDGYMDYLVPQIYFGFNNKTQPYEKNLKSWCDMVTNSKVKLVVGLAPYKLGVSENTGEWTSGKRIIARQIEAFRGSDKYGGAAFFRYESLFSPAGNVATQVKQELAELKAILT